VDEVVGYIETATARLELVAFGTRGRVDLGIKITDLGLSVWIGLDIQDIDHLLNVLLDARNRVEAAVGAA
jgi:hypothetical protein